MSLYYYAISRNSVDIACYNVHAFSPSTKLNLYATNIVLFFLVILTSLVCFYGTGPACHPVPSSIPSPGNRLSRPTEKKERGKKNIVEVCVL